jgi:hypothetical protein
MINDMPVHKVKKLCFSRELNYVEYCRIDPLAIQ